MRSLLWFLAGAIALVLVTSAGGLLFLAVAVAQRARLPVQRSEKAQSADQVDEE